MDTTKKVCFLFLVGNINRLWYLRKIELTFESRIYQQYLNGVLPVYLFNKGYDAVVNTAYA